MKLWIEFKPTTVVGKTKTEILNKISSGVYSFMRTCNGHYLCSSFAETPNKTIRVYSLEKRRKKVQRNMKNNKTISSTVISPDHWIGSYYDIPYSVAKALNIKVEQFARTFKISPR